jgi:hypothetical protein
MSSSNTLAVHRPTRTAPRAGLVALLLPLVMAGCDRTVTDPGNVAAAGAASTSLTTLADPPPIATEFLTGRHEFTDAVAIQVRDKPDGRPTAVVNLQDASNLVVLRITVQPGVSFPWHTHPGPVLVAVTEGEIVYVYADDCVERPYTAGTAFVDPGFANVHIAFNPSGTEETVFVATFLGAPPTGPLTLPVDAGTAAELNAKCGLGAASSHSH